MELFAAWAASVTTLVVITAARVSAIEKRLRKHEGEGGDGGDAGEARLGERASLPLSAPSLPRAS